MDRELYSNKAKTVLASEVSPSSTTITVADASKFPVLSAGQFFKVTIDDGTLFEIVKVYSVSGNIFSNIVRGADGTSARSFSVGTRTELRLTSGSLNEFARKQDKVADIDSVNSLKPPSVSDSNSYLCQSLDDSGCPILALSTSNNLWRFSGFPGMVVSGTIEYATNSALTIANALSLLTSNRPGSYILQFTTGQCAGYCRMLTELNSNSVGWSTILPIVPAVGDYYEIYSSTATYVQNSAKEPVGLYFYSQI